MKKVHKKTALVALATILTLGTITTSCSKDDNSPKAEEQPIKTNIDAAIGTYKGKLSSNDLDQYKHFDAVVIVSKVDDQHLKITPKSGEPYSSVTPKIFKVEVGYKGNIQSINGALEGYFWYTDELKTVEMGTVQQAQTDIPFLFDGLKQ